MIALLLVILFPLGIALQTYAFFWFETAGSAHRRYLEDLSNGRPGRLLMKGILSCYLSMLLTIALYPTSFWRRLRQIRARLPNAPSLPSFWFTACYHNVSAWTLYRRWLKAAGFTNIHVMHYSSFNRTFDQLLENLGQLVAEVRRRFPDKQPILIGHSLGGLLSRAFVQSEENSTKIGGVITLGTPHQGSKMAALGPGRLAQSLIYRGPLIEAMEKDGAMDTPPPCVVLYSPIDNMVLPNHALQTTTAGWVHQETSPISHVAMLYHKRRGSWLSNT